MPTIFIVGFFVFKKNSILSDNQWARISNVDPMALLLLVTTFSQSPWRRCVP